MPKLTQAVDTMLDTLLSGMVLGQPQVQVKRDGIALAVNKMTGRGLRKATVSAGTLDLQLVPDDDDNADAPMEVKVNARKRWMGRTEVGWGVQNVDGVYISWMGCTKCGWGVHKLDGVYKM